MAPSMEIEPSPTPESSPAITSDCGPPVVLCTAQDETGALLVTGNSCGSLRLWRRGAGQRWKAETEWEAGPSRGELTSLAFAPARLGAVVVATCTNGVATVLRLGDGRAQALRDALGPLFHAAFSARGALATVGEERVARIYERDARGRFRLAQALDVAVEVAGGATAIGSAGAVGGLAFRPGGDALAAGARIFARTPTARWVEVAGPHVRGARCAHWGLHLLAIGCEDGSVALCAPVSGGVEARERLVPPGDHRPVVQIEWDPTGAVVAAVHKGGIVRTWCRRPAADGGRGEHGVWAWSLRDEENCAADGRNSMSIGF